MMTENNTVESGIENKDLSSPETDPEKIRQLDGLLMPWNVDSAFKTLYVLSILVEKSGGKGVGSEVVAKELDIDEDRAISLIKVARTVIRNPMPGTISRVSLMYTVLSDALYAIQESESSDPESTRLATEALARVEAQEPEETPPEAVEAFKKEVAKATEKTKDI